MPETIDPATGRVFHLRARYTSPKTKGGYRSKTGGSAGVSTRKKSGAKVGNGGGMLTITATGKKVWSK